MAQALAADGRHILVVDRREPVRGSTLASTAMIQHEIDIPLSQLSKAIGAKKAMRAWRRSAASVDSLGARVGKLGLSCQFQQRTSLSWRAMKWATAPSPLKRSCAAKRN